MTFHPSVSNLERVLLASIVYRNWNGTFGDTWVVSPSTVNSITFTAQNIRRIQEAIAPAGDPNFQSEADRAAIVTLHRWSSLPDRA